MPAHEDAVKWIKTRTEPLIAVEELEAQIVQFERAHPDVAWKSVTAETVQAYTDFAQQAAMHILLMDQDAYAVAGVIYSHKAIFEAMGDACLLGSAGCLYFSNVDTESDDIKRSVMRDLTTWFPGVPVKDWLAPRWLSLYGQDRSRELTALWDGLWDMYQFFLTWPEWG